MGVRIIIDGREIAAADDKTILEAALDAGIASQPVLPSLP
jgi:NADH dehydrogenase/NADH:ubiquinone oxidoreductase subunit G